MSLHINKCGGQEIMIHNIFLWMLINSEQSCTYITDSGLLTSSCSYELPWKK